MVEIYDSHEQSERVKRWLQENGGAMALGLILAFGGLYGFKQWQVWQQSRDQAASAEYQVMVDYLDAGNLDAAVANYETLKEDHAKSSYTALAALYMAGARIESEQPDLAVPMLEFAMANATPAPLRTIARLRLARLKLAMGDTDGAEALLDGAKSTVGFEGRFAEIRGDLLHQQGDEAGALREYQSALSQTEEGVGDRNFLQLKIEALGGQVAGAEDA